MSVDIFGRYHNQAGDLFGHCDGQAAAPVAFARSTEENAADDRKAAAGYARRLLAVLGDGSKWEYTGDCQDNGKPVGKCSCGHEGLRFEFTLRHADGRTAVVGSTCIEHFQGITPEVLGAIQADAERLERAAIERKRQAKENAQAAEIQAALSELWAACWALDEHLATGAERYTYRCYYPEYRGDTLERVGFRSVRRVSREIFRRWHDAGQAAQRVHEREPGQLTYPIRQKQYKSRSAWLKAIRAQIAMVKMLSEPGKFWESSGY